jgi:hypothetical protein
VSYLEHSGKRPTWIEAPVLTSLLQDPGCAQCGAELVLNEKGISLTGKCLNCSEWITDEDEIFEDEEY